MDTEEVINKFKQLSSEVKKEQHSHHRSKFEQTLENQSQYSSLMASAYPGQE